MNKNLCQLFKLFGSDQFRFLIPKSRTVGSNTSICVPNPTLLQTPSIWFGGYGCVDIKILCQPKNKTKQNKTNCNLLKSLGLPNEKHLPISKTWIEWKHWQRSGGSGSLPILLTHKNAFLNLQNNNNNTQQT